VSRPCSICDHDERHAIDVALVSREPYRSIARRYEVSKDALSRHTQVHIPEYLAQAKRAVEVAEADSLLERVEVLYKRVEKKLDDVEEDPDRVDSFWRGVAQLRATLELLGEVTKELDRTPTINLALSPEYMEARTIIVGALEPFPDARQAVADALASSDSPTGHDGS
jgi:hypothetical protein